MTNVTRDVDTRFHETWLGMVQPVEGLVVSIPVLNDAQCLNRQPISTQAALIACTRLDEESGRRWLVDHTRLFETVLHLESSMFDEGAAISEALSLYVPEGPQTLRPTQVLRLPGEAPAALVWRLPGTLAMDKPETTTGAWAYAPAAKLDRLLRATNVPIGLLINDEAIRLVYAPHGESTGSITFKIDDMCSVGGRPILDGFVMLLSAHRFFGDLPERQLGALLRESRRHQASVTNSLARQVYEALEMLLRGFEAAASRQGVRDGDREREHLRVLLDEAIERDGGGGDFLYAGLLTVMLRLVFLLYAEDRGLLPTDQPLYGEHLSVLGLYAQLQADHGAHPDAMHLRYGAWARLVSLFRAIFLGIEHGELQMPARRGELFDPHIFPFLEGWGPGGSSPILSSEAQADVRVPMIDDQTVFFVLDRLVRLEGQRLSYRALDVEQIGAVYEALMGYHVRRAASPMVCLRPERVWINLDDLLAEPANRRVAWLDEEASVEKSRMRTAGPLIAAAKTREELRAAISPLLVASNSEVAADELYLQPGAERRRTSSHYTPASMTEPIARKTLDPIVKALGPSADVTALLSLKICDPAMGSGAFLVAACRYLADRVLAVWPAEKPRIDVLHARRLVAQRCLYGVDRNPLAVSLAKLSLWLETMARDEPFTFLDHALKHGDSLVGLSLDQIRAFHWKPEAPAKGTTPTFDEHAVLQGVETAVHGKKRGVKAKTAGAGESLALDALGAELAQSLDEAVELRQQILDWDLEHGVSPVAAKIKENLLFDATDSLDRVRLIGDVLVGAFFAHDKDKDRETERVRRLTHVADWLRSGGPKPTNLQEWQAQVRERIPVFHWGVEFPEVFYVNRPDPLEGGAVNEAAFMDAFVGNPPFMGKNGVAETGGAGYLDWLQVVHEGAHGNADLSAHFFRRADSLLGRHGTLGLIATNTIGQGDTRATGLQYLVNRGLVIYDATRSMLWPGEANVAVSVIHMAKGAARDFLPPAILDGEQVPSINSRLRVGQERADPVVLCANEDKSFQGCVVLGMGFTLTQEERDALVSRDPPRLPSVPDGPGVFRNEDRIFPYLGGEEVNTNPTQSHDRYVISFGQMSLEDAERWPDLLAVLREKVKPERDRAADNADGRRRKLYWWQFGRWTPALFEAIRPTPRCLVTSIVSKHLMFSFQASTRVFSHKLEVFPFSKHSQFALLQSRVHGPWARLLSSTLEERLNYSASDCFETFPFPACLQPENATPTVVGRGSAAAEELEAIGAEVYEARRRYMVESTPQVGLTITYNRLKDPGWNEAAILELRKLHEAMDRAVLRAYGWDDLAERVPPYCPKTEADRAAVQRFEDEVVDRLFALNEARAKEEKAAERLREQQMIEEAKRAREAGRAGPKGKAAQKPDANESFGPAHFDWLDDLIGRLASLVDVPVDVVGERYFTSAGLLDELSRNPHVLEPLADRVEPFLAAKAKIAPARTRGIVRNLQPASAMAKSGGSGGRGKKAPAKTKAKEKSKTFFEIVDEFALLPGEREEWRKLGE